MPILHSTSATVVPVSASFSAKVICASANLLYFTAPLLPSGFHKTGKLALEPDKGDWGSVKRVIIQEPDHAGAMLKLWVDPLTDLE
jgi:hypothetical protein